MPADASAKGLPIGILPYVFHDGFEEVALQFTSPPAASFEVGEAGSFAVTTNEPAQLELVGTLPDGLSFDAGAGVLSGTPAALTGGARPLQITARNSSGRRVQTLTLTVDEVPEFTSTDTATCTVGTPCAFGLSAIGFPAPAYTLPGLPAGLELDPDTGLVSGTPAASTGAVYSLTATATNALGDDSQPFSLTINEAPLVTSADSHACEAALGCEFHFTATGFPAPQFSLPGLPSGMSLDAVSGVLSGTPEIGSDDVYELTLSADNGIAPLATQAFTLEVAPATLRITAVDPPILVPGTQATLTGILFDPIAVNNTVTIDGVQVAVGSASSTSLTVTVPCIESGTVPLRVQVGTDISPEFPHPLQANEQALAVGESVIVTDPARVGCTELAATGEDSRYVVTVFSSNPSPGSNAPFQLSADGLDGGRGTAGPLLAQSPLRDVLQNPHPTRSPSQLAEENADRTHLYVLEQNEREYARLFERFADDPRMHRESHQPSGGPVEPPLTRTFRISNLSPPAGQSICSSFYVLSATRVYYDGTLAIYEDDATPNAFKASLNPTMALNYQRIGDQFIVDMEPIVRENYGDILRRDATTDNNGVLVALFTPHINNNVPGVAGFVVSCDQFPNDDTGSPAVGGPYTTTGGSNGASNFGEFFYAYQPAVDAVGYSGNTPQNWYRTIRSTFIHESKHVASQAARVANGAPSYESSWLEEGTARHVEELWMREAVDFQPWLSNVPYGSLADPINLYCDVRPGFAECDANPRRPASIMQRHFTSLYTHLFGSNARLLSPFGPTPSDNASYFYAISWSLVRYAIDRYGSSDAEFLTDLTQSTTSGVANLTARAGVPLDELLGGWALSLVTDDYPGLEVQNPDLQMQTWNFRSIYAGLNADFPGTYTLTYPQAPTQFPFGSFTAPDVATLRGGGALWYELSGTQTEAQLLRLTGAGGTPAPAELRVGIARVQ